MENYKVSRDDIQNEYAVIDWIMVNKNNHEILTKE